MSHWNLTQARTRMLIPIIAALLALTLLGGTTATAWAAEANGMEADSMDSMSAMGLTVTGWKVNVRNGPSLDHAIKVKLKRGDALTAHGRNADGTWLQISYPGGGPDRRWISGELTSVTDEQLTTLPVVEGACEYVTTSGYIFAYMSPSETSDHHFLRGKYRAFGQRVAEDELWYEIYFRGGRRWLKVTDLHNPCGPLETLPDAAAMGM